MNKKLVAVAVSTALATPMAAHAVKYKLSGQVNRAVIYVDDGEASAVSHVDNTASGTRVRLVGSEDLGNGMKVGFNWEWQNSSNQITRNQLGGAAGTVKAANTADNQTLRKAEVWFSGNWGKLTLGQGDGAGNGATEVDLSDTWNATYVIQSSPISGVAWRTSAGGALGLTVGQTYTTFDAFSRYDRVRYDTPAFGPVTISGSFGQDDLWEVAARLATSIGGGQLSGALFYGESGDGARQGTRNELWGGSVAFLFSQGTNILFSYSTADTGGVGPGNDPDNWYVKLGHKWGNNAVSVAYGETSGAAVVGTNEVDANGFQVGFNHNIPKAAVDIYASYHWMELDGLPAGVGVEDVQAFMVGTKLRFD